MIYCIDIPSAEETHKLSQKAIDESERKLKELNDYAKNSIQEAFEAVIGDHIKKGVEKLGKWTITDRVPGTTILFTMNLDKYIKSSEDVYAIDRQAYDVVHEFQKAFNNQQKETVNNGAEYAYLLQDCTAGWSYTKKILEVKLYLMLVTADTYYTYVG